MAASTKTLFNTPKSKMNLSQENNRVFQPFSVRGLIVKQLEDLNDYELLKSVNYLGLSN